MITANGAMGSLDSTTTIMIMKAGMIIAISIMITAGANWPLSLSRSNTSGRSEAPSRKTETPASSEGNIFSGRGMSSTRPMATTPLMTTRAAI